MTVRAFIARKDTRTPTVFGCLTLVLSVCFALIFMGPIAVPENQYMAETIYWLQTQLLTQIPSLPLGHAGLALATGLATTISFFGLSLVLRKRIPELVWKPFFTCSIRSLLASALMFTCVNYVANSMQPLGQLIIGIPVGVLTYSIASFFLKSPELQETSALLLRKIKR